MSKTLARIIRNAVEKKAYRVGSREVLKHLSDAKLIICSNSLSNDAREKIESMRDSILVYNINKNSVELGRFVGKPFRVSVISIEDAEREDLDALAKEIA